MATKSNIVSLDEGTWKRLDEIVIEIQANNRQDAIAYLIANYEVH